MLGHTRKHPISEAIFFRGKSRMKIEEESSNWRDAAKEALGNIPSNALNLRGLRNREGLTQAQFAKAIGSEQSNISKMERGERQIGTKIAKKLEKMFNIDYRLFL